MSFNNAHELFLQTRENCLILRALASVSPVAFAFECTSILCVVNRATGWLNRPTISTRFCGSKRIQ